MPLQDGQVRHVSGFAKTGESIRSLVALLPRSGCIDAGAVVSQSSSSSNMLVTGLVGVVARGGVG